jgi:hypothetical protein
MADNQENQAMQPDGLQPPDDEPQLGQYKNDPKVEPGEQKLGEERNSSSVKKTDNSRWMTAVIGAIAALIGVLIGSFASYYAAQSQANASATAKAKVDLINKRQKDYADYFKNEKSLANAEASLAAILRSNPGDFGALDPAKDKWNKDSVTVARSDFILSFNGSDKSNNIREEISHQTDAIHKALARLMDQAYAHEPIDQSSLQGLDTMFVALQSQFDRFAEQAKADLRSPNGGLPS